MLHPEKKLIRSGGTGVKEVYFDDFKVTHTKSPVIQVTDLYPYGAVAQSYTRENSLENKHLYQSKELITELGLEQYDFHARQYDPWTVQTTTQDPLAEKFYDLSPYSWVAGNPMRYVDPTGMEFTDAAMEWVNRLVRQLNSQQQSNSATMAELQDKINAGGLSDKKIDRLNNRIDRLQSQNTELEVTRGEIFTMGASSQVYDVVSDNSMSEPGAVQGMGTEVGGAAFNFSNGNFEIRMPRSGGLSMFAHELKHGYQFETGQYSVGPRVNDATRWNFLYDQHDELAAYQRGRLFGGSSHPTLNSLPDRYKGIATGPTDVTNHPNISSIMGLPASRQREVYQRIANTTLHAFRVNGVTYYRPR